MWMVTATAFVRIFRFISPSVSGRGAAVSFRLVNTYIIQHILKFISRRKYNFHSTNGIGIYIYIFY